MIHLLYEIIAAIWHSQLLGVVVGIIAARQWQSRQWRLDACRTEYRELLSTLSKSGRVLYNDTFLGGVAVTTGEDARRTYEADVEARSTIEDRIFIAHQIQRENILERWSLMAGERNAAKFMTYWSELHSTLVSLAHTDLGIKNRAVRKTEPLHL